MGLLLGATSRRPADDDGPPPRRDGDRLVALGAPAQPSRPPSAPTQAEGYAPRGCVILFEDNVRDEVRAWAHDTGFGIVIETSEVEAEPVGSIDILLDPVTDAATATPPA